MINVEDFMHALKCSWIRRLIQNQKAEWAILFETTISHVRKMLDFGSGWCKMLYKKTSNQFWKEIFMICYNVFEKLDLKTNE